MWMDAEIKAVSEMHIINDHDILPRVRMLIILVKCIEPEMLDSDDWQ